MVITIEKKIDTQTKELWTFNVYGFDIVFFQWQRHTKNKYDREFTHCEYWNVYGDKKGNIKSPEPHLPDIIKSEALMEAYKLLRVKTLEEWNKK